MSEEENNIRLQGRLMWGILALCAMFVYFHRFSLAVVLDDLVADLMVGSAFWAGALAGTYAVMYMIMQVPSGLLADFWGPRKTVTTGMLVTGSGTLVFALSPTLLISFLGRGLIGLGVSVILISILKFHSSWFKPSIFATMAGLIMFIGNTGSVLGTAPLALLVDSWGWRKSFYLTGLLTFLVAALCWLIVRDAPQLPARKNDKCRKEKHPLGLRQRLAALSGMVKRVLLNRDTWPLVISAFGVYGTFTGFAGAWSLPYLMQIYEYSKSEASSVILAAPAGMTVGGPVIGFLSDRLGRRKGLYVLLIFLHCVLWGLFLCWNRGKPPEAALIPIFFMLGLSGASVVLGIALARELNKPGLEGTAMGVINMAPFAGMALFQPLLGFVLDARWDGLLYNGVKVYPLESYRLLFLTCFLTMLVCLWVSRKIKETGCQNIHLDF